MSLLFHSAIYNAKYMMYIFIYSSPEPVQLKHPPEDRQNTMFMLCVDEHIIMNLSCEWKCIF